MIDGNKVPLEALEPPKPRFFPLGGNKVGLGENGAPSGTIFPG